MIRLAIVYASLKGLYKIYLFFFKKYLLFDLITYLTLITVGQPQHGSIMKKNKQKFYFDIPMNFIQHLLEKKSLKQERNQNESINSIAIYKYT